MSALIHCKVLNSTMINSEFGNCQYHPTYRAPTSNQRMNVLRSRRISRKSAALIMRYSQKKNWISIVFYCSENYSIAHKLGTTGPIQVGVSAKCISPNEHFNQIENWKCHMCEFWLISLDHITNDESVLSQITLIFCLNKN